MEICGCCAVGVSDCGAFGFSNERSLTYCATTLSCGGWFVAGAGPPLVVDMKTPKAQRTRIIAGGWLTQRHGGNKDWRGQWQVLPRSGRHPVSTESRQRRGQTLAL